MKIAELQQLELELVEDLRKRSAGGDNEAAQILLAHLRQVSKDIADGQKTKDNKTKKE